MKISEKLKRRLVNELHLNSIEGSSHILISRNPGRWQKEQGAWSWYALNSKYGSPYTMKECFEAEALELFDLQNGHIEIHISTRIK